MISDVGAVDGKQDGQNGQDGQKAQLPFGKRAGAGPIEFKDKILRGRTRAASTPF